MKDKTGKALLNICLAVIVFGFLLLFLGVALSDVSTNAVGALIISAGAVVYIFLMRTLKA